MSLDQLLRHPAIWRAREQGESPGRRGRPTGYAALDRVLPGGGWPSQGLVEILADRTGIGELSLLLPALARLCNDENEGGWLACISPPHPPYAPAKKPLAAIDRALMFLHEHKAITLQGGLAIMRQAMTIRLEDGDRARR